MPANPYPGAEDGPLSPPEDFVLNLDENLHNCKPILNAANSPFPILGLETERPFRTA
jgi:hypothetical protein